MTIIMKISYYAILQKDDDGMWVKFPDLGGCFTNGDEGNIEQMAKEAMELYLDNMDINSIPSSSGISDFTLENNQTAVKIAINVEVRNSRININKELEAIEKEGCKMKKKYCLMKLDEDDILEILVEHFQGKENFGCSQARACLIGESGKDLRFIGVFSNDEEKIQCDFEKIDKEMDYNGDHSVLNKNSGFWISNPSKNL